MKGRVEMRVEVMNWAHDVAGVKMIKLEDGRLLHDSEWNGETYTVREDGREISYRPIYVGVGEPDDDGDYAEYEMVAFERLL